MGMKHLKLNSILLALSLILSRGTVFGDYHVPPMDKVFQVVTSIADVTVSSLDEQGHVRLKVNQELKGKQPALLTGVSLSCNPMCRVKVKVGKRYLVICWKDMLYEESTQYEIRVRDGVAECWFPQGNVIYGKRQWTSLEDIRKLIRLSLRVKKG